MSSYPKMEKVNECCADCNERVFLLFANLEDEELGQHEAMDKTALEKREP